MSATHVVSLGVGVEGSENRAQVFQDLSELASNLGEAHPYVSVTSSTFDDDPDETTEHECEALRYDENTLVKVREALRVVMRSNQNERLTEDVIDDCVREMQNAGILFRERPKGETF